MLMMIRCGGQFAYQLTDKDNKAVATSFAGTLPHTHGGLSAVVVVFKKVLTHSCHALWLAASAASGYMFAVGLILWASLTDLTDNQGKNIGYAPLLLLLLHALA